MPRGSKFLHEFNGFVFEVIELGLCKSSPEAQPKRGIVIPDWDDKNEFT